MLPGKLAPRNEHHSESPESTGAFAKPGSPEMSCGLYSGKPQKDPENCREPGALFFPEIRLARTKPKEWKMYAEA